MFTFLLILHILVCLILIFIVLLQQPQKGGMALIFGGGESIFGGGGLSPFMIKLTSAIAALLLITSISLVLTSQPRVPRVQQRTVEQQRR
ncbi:MAG: preprotein translocase subunit SecG [candidate division WOR-3 bacterium]|nr:preprotein translocase subunit SecG [candidate division WOR-3 bacterium]MDW8113523.1 preprotein translocase subunit SecG [candidate division WOR-3 bacterium]